MVSFSVKITNLFYKYFDKSFGKVIRLVQRTSLKKSLNEKFYELLESYAIEDSVKCVLEQMPAALYFSDKAQLRSHIVDLLPNLKTNNGLILEFGVYKGTSINFFAGLCPNSKIVGFDSFLGLEEDWVGHWPRKGWFNMDGNPPHVLKNVTLIKGLFEDTLSNYLKSIKLGSIDLVHLDADTYKPTKYVLNLLIPKLKRGAIIIFDEFFGYPGWQQHEYKAWHETVKKYGLKYKYLGYTEKQVGIQILK